MRYNAAFLKDVLFKNINAITLFKAFKFSRGKKASAASAVISETNILYTYTAKTLPKNKLFWNTGFNVYITNN